MKHKQYFYIFLGICSILAVTIFNVMAQDDRSESEVIIVTGAWVRPSEEISAAYFQIRNDGEYDIELISVETDIGMAEIHETQIENDIMRMRPIERVIIAPDETIRFEPAGYHVMIMGLSDAIVEGDSVDLTLNFASGTAIEITAFASQFPIPYELDADNLTNESLIASDNGLYLGRIANPPIQVQDFTAPSNFEDITQLSDTNETWRVIFFGYLHCPDFCPLTLSDYTRVQDILGDGSEAVTFTFISVDAVRDTADAIIPYLANFDPSFVGFLPDDDTLFRIQADYGFYYERRMESGTLAIYSVDHSTRSYLLDPNGVLRASFAYDTHPQDIADALQWYIEHENLIEG
ncbi:MAG: hypothetical protein Crog4KO_35560 [Crocinitomicaceae bacterium]